MPRIFSPNLGPVLKTIANQRLYGQYPSLAEWQGANLENHRLSRFLMKIESASTQEELVALAERTTREYRFRNYAFSYYKFGDNGLELNNRITNLSGTTLEIYSKLVITEDSPCFINMHKTDTPLIWNTAGAASGSPQEQEVCQTSSDLGFASGIACPVVGAPGLLGFAIFAGDREPLTERETTELQVLGILLHARLAESAQESRPSGTSSLTARELEILNWAAKGKSSPGIAGILGISTRTADQHFDNLARKLGTVNRVHSVAEALRQGLLDLSDG